MPAPDVTRYDAPGRPRAVILMFHGGREHGLTEVNGRSTQWRRSLSMQRSISHRAHQQGVSTWLLRYRLRGWNAGPGREPMPVSDARWALDEVRRRLGEVPVVLLGHSMGARTAVYVADHDLVTGVVAVAPWFPRDAPVDLLKGRHLAAAHGRKDKITSFRATEQFVQRAAEFAVSTEMHDMGPVGHYLLRRIPKWNEFAVSRSLRFLDDVR